MIGYLKGNVLSSKDGVVLLEVNGVGYELTCSLKAFERLDSDKKGEVYTYLAVRDDGIFLYGMDSVQEKEMFLKLITVTGVGPKMAITILSGMELKDIAFSIARSDIVTLAKVKGLGKKTAERIILELREKIESMDLPEDKKKPVQKNSPIMEDAVIALMSLGFTRGVSQKAVEYACSQGASTVEEILTIALQSMK